MEKENFAKEHQRLKLLDLAILPQVEAISLESDEIILKYGGTHHLSCGNISYEFKIFTKQSQLAVGHISINFGDVSETCYYYGNIGYGINEEHRGKGYAGKALQLLLTMNCFTNFKITGLKQLFILVDPSNIASSKTALKAGFVQIDEVKIPANHRLNYQENETDGIRYAYFTNGDDQTSIKEKIKQIQTGKYSTGKQNKYEGDSVVQQFEKNRKYIEEFQHLISTNKCPKQHNLFRINQNSEHLQNYVCDQCDQSSYNKCDDYRCNTCDFDICSKCLLEIKKEIFEITNQQFEIKRHFEIEHQQQNNYDRRFKQELYNSTLYCQCENQRRYMEFIPCFDGRTNTKLCDFCDSHIGQTEQGSYHCGTHDTDYCESCYYTQLQSLTGEL